MTPDHEEMKEAAIELPRLWIVTVIDFVATYAYAFTVNGLLYGRSGAHADWIYWVAQPWVYALIAPVAIVAAWRGTRRVRAAWLGVPRWWRLCLEGAAAAAASMVLVAIFERAAIVRAIAEAAAIGAGLGLFLICINFWLVRVRHWPGIKYHGRIGQ